MSEEELLKQLEMIALRKRNDENASERFENTMIYFNCMEKLKMVSKLMEAYPKTMTLEELRESLTDQMVKYRNILFYDP